MQNRLSIWLRGHFQRRSNGESGHQSTLKLSALSSLEQALERPESLPERYWRFFLPTPLQEEGLLIGREDELDRLDKVFKNWQDGPPRDTASWFSMPA